jgi:hypothetical protein
LWRRKVLDYISKVSVYPAPLRPLARRPDANTRAVIIDIEHGVLKWNWMRGASHPVYSPFASAAR